MAEKSILDRIGLGLQGFGAGVEGRGPEFLNALQDRENAQTEKLSREREDALLQDAFMVSQHLQGGNTEGAIRLLENRIQHIDQLNGDPSDTIGLRDQIASGDTEGALRELNPLIQFAQAQGRLTIPQEAQTRREIINGQVVDIPPTGPVTAQDIEGFRAPAAELKQRIVDGQIINIDPTTGQAMAAPIPGFRQDPGRQVDRSLRARQVAVMEAAERRQSQKLSAGLEKALLSSQDATLESQRNANSFDALADDFTKAASIPGGVKGSVSETLKALLGSQDEVSELRRRFNQIRVSEGLRNLPPGTASDSDVKLAMSGLPPENANPETVAAFLRGAARLSRFEAGFNQFKSDYISEKSTGKGINQTWRRQLEAPALGGERVTISEIYETAQNRGMTPEAVAEQLGIQGDLFR